jgi:hypothetical protein
MIVSAIFSNASTDIVSTEELDELLQKNALLAFHRSDGWAFVGVDEMRSSRDRTGSSWMDRKTLSRRRSVRQSSNS